MSLQLRQACQSSLDGIGLTKYHVSVRNERYDKQRKSMLIVGECGKLLTEITGILFSRLNPTKIEITYAVELLEVFLVKHGADIKDFVKAINSKPIDPRNDSYTSGAQIEDHYKKDAIQYKDGPFTLVVYKGKVYVNSVMTTTVKTVQNFIPDPERLKKANKVAKELPIYVKSQQHIEELKEKLNKCEI